MSFRYYPSIFNEINNKIRQSTSYVDCKLMFFDGSLVVNFAKLVAAGFWWTRFNNFLKKICNLVAFHLKPRGCLVINNKICEQRQYAIGSCTKNEQGACWLQSSQQLGSGSWGCPWWKRLEAEQCQRHSSRSGTVPSGSSSSSSESYFSGILTWSRSCWGPETL